MYHTGRLVSTAALDVMTTQRDVVYTARAETRAKVHKRDKVSAGVTVARLVEEGGPPTKVRRFAGLVSAQTAWLLAAAGSPVHLHAWMHCASCPRH